MIVFYLNNSRLITPIQHVYETIRCQLNTPTLIVRLVVVAVGNIKFIHPRIGIYIYVMFFYSYFEGT